MRRIILYIIIICVWFSIPNINLFGQKSSQKPDSIKKQEFVKKQDSISALKKSQDSIEALEPGEFKVFIKKIFHKSDSTKLAKRYQRWYKKSITGKKEDYRISIKKKNLIDSIDYEIIFEDKKPKKEVLGWYPYWTSDLYKKLNYSLLTTIAYFDYKVNPITGDPETIHQWKTTSMIDSAKVNDIKVLLTVTNFGNAKNTKLLSNPIACDNLINKVIELLDFRQANGVCIDFEGIHKSQKKNYNSFIAYLSQRLKQHNKDYLVYLAIPSVNWQSFLDFDALVPAVDQFVIMGYDYYGSTSKIAGPVSPLESGKIWQPFNLTSSIDYYLGKGIPSKKMILALPFYGNLWYTKTGHKGSKIDAFISGITNDSIESFIKKHPEFKVQNDLESESSWITYFDNKRQKNTKRQFKQLWFDSEENMKKKLDLIIAKDLNGLGIWALGYNKNYQKHWRAVEEILKNKESDQDSTRSDTLKIPDEMHIIITVDDEVKKEPSIWNKLSKFNEILQNMSEPDTTKAEEKPEIKIAKSRLQILIEVFDKIGYSEQLLKGILLFVVIFGGLGFVISMFMPNTRMFFFSSTAITIYYTFFGLLFLCLEYHSWKVFIFVNNNFICKIKNRYTK